MRVKLGPYKSWWGPYQLAEILCFWAKNEKDEFGFPHKPDWVHRFGEWLAYGSVRPKPAKGETHSLFDNDRKPTLLYRFLIWIDSKRSRTIDVRIDPWDTWNMDSTLGYIIRPMLHQLKKTKHGSPMVDLEDVPEELRPSDEEQAAYNRDGTTDENFFKRWDWVLDEMIFAFESLPGGANENWEDQFHSGKIDFEFVPVDDKLDTVDQKDASMYRLEKTKQDTSVFDRDGYLQYQNRISKGFLLFGKYYSALWD